MTTEKRNINGQTVEVKVFPPSRRRAHARIRRVHVGRTGNQIAAKWIAKDSGQICR